MSDARTSPATQARYAVPAVLELRGVSKVYGSGAAEVHALRQADLSVEAGSMVAAVGPRGAGELTLLDSAGSPGDPPTGGRPDEGARLAGVSPGRDCPEPRGASRI